MYLRYTMDMFFKRSKKTIYADCAAATPLSKNAHAAMDPYWRDIFYNPHALYDGGVRATQALEQSRQTIADHLGVQDHTITFTGGATESNNLALQGVLKKYKCTYPDRTPHIIMSPFEHEAIRNQVQTLSQDGLLTYDEMPISSDGIVDVRALKGLITQNTALISIIYAHNEIGTIQPLREITKTVRWWKKHNTSNVYPLVHTDAVQAPLYIDMHIPRLGIDLLTASGAKIHGPKGVAILYSASRDYLEPIIYGGGQEAGLRSGTENVPLIVGFAQAFDEAREHYKERFATMENRGAYARELFQECASGIRINGSISDRLPNNINISIDDVHSEELVLRLDADGILCSSQSACSTDSDESYVIHALHPGDDALRGSLRFTFQEGISRKDIAYIRDRLKYHIETIRQTHQRFHSHN